MIAVSPRLPAMIVVAGLVLSACAPATPATPAATAVPTAAPTPQVANTPVVNPTQPAAATPTAALKPAAATQTAAPAAATAAPVAAPKPAATAIGIDRTALQRLYDQARAQGPVLFSSPSHDADIKGLIDLFHQTYPDVEIQFQSVESGNLVANIRTQQAAQNVQVDLASVTMTYAPVLDQAGAMQKVDWASLGIPPQNILQGVFVKSYDNPQGIAYNPKTVAPEEVPQTWDDLLKPRFGDGKIATNATANFAAAFQIDPDWGQQRALDFARKLAEQHPLVEQRAETGLNDVISGQADVSTADLTVLLQDVAQGAQLEVAPVSPQISQTNGFFIPLGAKHQAGAELFGAWLLTPEAKQLWEKETFRGDVSSCDASDTARWVCSKGVRLVYYQDFAQITASTDFVKQFQKAMGTLQGNQ
jgi:iron(III) transport system substrate-binding protein